MQLWSSSIYLKCLGLDSIWHNRILQQVELIQCVLSVLLTTLHISLNCMKTLNAPCYKIWQFLEDRLKITNIKVQFYCHKRTRRYSMIKTEGQMKLLPLIMQFFNLKRCFNMLQLSLWSNCTRLAYNHCCSADKFILIPLCLAPSFGKQL